jgi:hypothetical protein
MTQSDKTRPDRTERKAQPNPRAFVGFRYRLGKVERRLTAAAPLAFHLSP